MRCSRRSAKRRCATARSKRATRCSTSVAVAAIRRCVSRRAAQPPPVSTFRSRCSRARANARPRNGLAATFTLGDAAETRFDAEYDLLFSRFGVMFFGDPTAAFANLHGALRASAKLCFVCWQAPNFNPWISVPFSVALPLLPPQPTLEPRAPGPFAFAEPDYVREILTGAGFKSVTVDRAVDIARARRQRRLRAADGLRGWPLEPLVGGHGSSRPDRASSPPCANRCRPT